MSDRKPDCQFGERCYRLNVQHFQEYEHQHLNIILKRLETSTIEEVRKGLRLYTSHKTFYDQIEILKSLKSNSHLATGSPEHPASGKSSTDEGKQSPCDKSRKRHSKHNSDKDSPRKIQKGSTESNGEPSTSKSKENRKHMDDSDRALSSESHRKRMEGAKNLSEAMAYFNEVKKRSQGNILEKHKAAAPYYFFLTSVTDSRETHSERLSLQLFDILDPALGDLESSLQINFMVEFGWLMAQYHISNQRGKPITLLYGEMDVANLDMKHVTAVQVKPPSPFGSHHTKMCVLAYRDGSVRVCVHTANLVESDWDNRVQGVWLSPLCPALPPGADSTAGESPTFFKNDLLEYLSAYRLPQVQPWLGKLRRADFSQINVFFVASTPGSHKGVDATKWGHGKLASLLQRHVVIKPEESPNSWQIITQCSSIGSLGPQPSSWFCGEIKATLSKGVGQTLRCPPPIRLVYPTFDNVASSYDGLLGGGCLPYSAKTHAKQPWLQDYLYQWKCECRHRTRAMPHIKSYTRVSPDLSRIAYFHLTSANLSKAAWGSKTKAGALTILSYEAGVLFLPKFVVKSTAFPIKEGAAGSLPLFTFPYDLPLTKYQQRDVPWFMDNLS